MLNFIKNISPTEIIVIVFILLLFFGAKFVTKIGKVGGETLKEAKKIKKNINKAVEGNSDKK